MFLSEGIGRLFCRETFLITMVLTQLIFMIILTDC